MNYWVIEFIDYNKPLGYCWLQICAIGSVNGVDKMELSWTAEPLKALRFARKQDAEMFKGLHSVQGAAVEYTVSSPDDERPVEAYHQGSIPKGVYWEGDNFYDTKNRGKGNDFYRTWKTRYAEFPQGSGSLPKPEAKNSLENPHNELVGWYYEYQSATSAHGYLPKETPEKELAVYTRAGFLVSPMYIERKRTL